MKQTLPPSTCASRCCVGCVTLGVCLLGGGVAVAQAPPPADAEDSLETPEAVPDAAVVRPRVVERVEAAYPAEALAARREAVVELLVTVRDDGSVGPVEVSGSADAAFDAAAIAAVLQWRFEPAQRNGEPVESRIRVPFHFEIPDAVATDPAGPEESADGADGGEPVGRQMDNDPNADGLAGADPPAIGVSAETSSDDEAPIDVTVRGERALRAETRSASDYQIDRQLLAAAPRQEGVDILRAAPGLYIGRAEGPAVAHNYNLRGFDAEHGQDIAFRVGGLPINLPSHIHGQGYSDLNFLIGDVTSSLRVREGVYDPQQGDFAVAGSIDIDLGVADSERGVRLQSSYGAFNTFRQLVRWAPQEAPEETFGAAVFSRTDGFGQNRAGQRGSALFQHRFGDGDLRFRAIGIVHGARSELAGVLRQDDIDAGRLCFECVYPVPTATAQNALANRVMTGFFADYRGGDGQNGQLGAWLGYDNFRSQGNFTGFVQSSRTLDRVAGRGDLIEQQNRTFSAGLLGRYRSAPLRLAPWAQGTIEVGADSRIDLIDQSQNLLDAAVRNQTWDQQVDASIRGLDVGLWGDLDWTFTSALRLRVGLRADILSYDVDDRLGNFVPLTRPQDSFLPGFRRTAFGLAFGPRASVEVKPVSWLSLLAAYGEGYRSPQARLLEDGESAPFSKVRSVDVGLRVDLGNPLQLTVAGYYTRLSDDIAFEAEEGRLEQIGATQRLGVAVHAVTRPLDWLVGSLSVTFVDATLLEPPPATAEEPQPAFEDGQNLPFVPPVVVRADVAAKRVLLDEVLGKALTGRVGLGFSYLSPRPLPFGEFADPVTLLDASAGVMWGPVNLTFEIFNLLDTQYAAIEYAFPSDWNPDDGVRPRTPARHISAGAPFSWMVSLGVRL